MESTARSHSIAVFEPGGVRATSIGEAFGSMRLKDFCHPDVSAAPDSRRHRHLELQLRLHERIVL